jgi:hypothetical protein
MQQASSLSSPALSAEELKPQLTSAAQLEKIPKTAGKELKPRMGSQPQKPPTQPAGKTLRPKISDGEGD